MSRIQESTVYENCVVEGDPPPPPSLPPKKSDYPKTLKVHLDTREHCDAFAQLLRQNLSSDRKEITFHKLGRAGGKGYRFDEKRTDPLRSRTTHLDREETALWGETTDFKNDHVPQYMTFLVTFDTEAAFVRFARLLKQQISLTSQYVYFPAAERAERTTRFWVSKFDDNQPRYPIYIVSKGRADSRFTARTLEKMGVPYRVLIEPQDWHSYKAVIDPKKLLVAPFSNHGDGPGRARNYVWDHAISEGYAAHWVMDDNLDGFFLLHENERVRANDGGFFRVMEDFFDRFENLYIAGPQYKFFCSPKSPYPPFITNTRIYSCLLIRNDCRHRWRGRYNEDTDLSLRVLKDGDCTLQWNAFLQGKLGTQLLAGGNTAEFYHAEYVDDPDEIELGQTHAAGTWLKSKMLVDLHPDVSTLVERFGRWHHHVDYSGFKQNKLRFKAGREVDNRRYEFDLVG